MYECVFVKLILKTDTWFSKKTTATVYLNLKKSLLIVVLASHLRHSDPTLFGQFLLGFLTGVRVRQVGVEILVQHLCSLLVEVAPFTSVKQRRDNDQHAWNVHSCQHHQHALIPSVFTKITSHLTQT